jgi:hypothetical protein
MFTGVSQPLPSTRRAKSGNFAMRHCLTAPHGDSGSGDTFPRPGDTVGIGCSCSIFMIPLATFLAPDLQLLRNPSPSHPRVRQSEKDTGRRERLFHTPNPLPCRPKENKPLIQRRRLRFPAPRKAYDVGDDRQRLVFELEPGWMICTHRHLSFAETRWGPKAVQSRAWELFSLDCT